MCVCMYIYIYIYVCIYIYIYIYIRRYYQSSGKQPTFIYEFTDFSDKQHLNLNKRGQTYGFFLSTKLVNIDTSMKHGERQQRPVPAAAPDGEKGRRIMLY